MCVGIFFEITTFPNNNFIVSNDNVLVLELCKICTDVVIVGNRSIILKFSYAHQDASMESTSYEGKGVHLHTLVDRERKRSNERG